MNNRIFNVHRKVFIRLIFFIIFTIVFVLTSLLILWISGSFSTATGAEVFSEENPTSVVIIDAGHGGEDGGALSADGLCEKDINLDIAKKLCQFMTLSDYKVIMTRDDDRLLYDKGTTGGKKHQDISNRIKIASSYENSIFVSVHQNKFPIRKYSGFQVYFSKNNPESKKLASVIQQNVKSHLQHENKREIKMADKNIRLLDSVQIPAVLAECGFLSNEHEAQLLADPEYRSKIAYLIYISIISYLSEY